MEKTYALINEGLVINLIVWDGLSVYETKEEKIEVPEGQIVEIGYKYADGLFSIE